MATLGEYRVGISFNPGGNELVNKIKRGAADLHRQGESMSDLWRHKKRGTVYTIEATDALIQCSMDPEIEDRHGRRKWTVYRDIATNKTYLRPTSEFNDGRFERVTASRAMAGLHADD